MVGISKESVLITFLALVQQTERINAKKHCNTSRLL
jgi:hypothetical protein